MLTRILYKFSRMKDYYKTLQVPPEANITQIKNQYHKLAKKYHPDINKNTQNIFKEINQAYQVLSDPKQRSQYDLSYVSNQSTGHHKFTQKKKYGPRTNAYYRAYNVHQNYYQNRNMELNEKIARQQFRMIFGLMFSSILIYYTLVFPLHKTNQDLKAPEDNRIYFDELNSGNNTKLWNENQNDKGNSNNMEKVP